MPRKQRIREAGLRRENDPPLLVLMSLAAGPKHGRALMEDIAEFGGVRLGPGTLYGAITRLEAEALIEALPVEGNRRPYRLTERGAESLAAMVNDLQRFAEVGRRRLIALHPAAGLH
ncbi:MAG TPA: PadR family transcriptional regulator [Acidimicrobiales bacterium]|nr:PadR family transcriptional regulator [Acidimicrobiales bacterium]